MIVPSIDRFIPATLRTDPETLSRARVTAWVSVLLCAAAGFFIWQTPALDPSGPRPLWIGIGALTVNWALLQRHLNLTWAAAVVSLSVAAVVAAIGYCGAGVEEPAMVWITAGPLLAVLLVGRGFGQLVAALAFAAVIGLYLLGAEPGRLRPRGADTPYFLMLSLSAFVVVVYACAGLYDRSRAAALDRLGEALRQLQASSDRAQQLAAESAAARQMAESDAALKGEFFRRMMGNAHHQGEALSASRAAIARLAEAVRAVAANVTELREVARGSGESVERVATTSKDTQQQVGLMSDALHETSASIEEMRMTLRETSKNVDALMQAAEATNTSMAEMERSIAGVERSATQTATLADTVIRDAERGRNAVEATLRGTESIREKSRAAADSLRALAERIGDIDAILTVIQEVAERTNLLALNASIIAAQAGEHGKGFAVVAHEIKELAERTAGSVKQIGEIIDSVQRQSAGAVAAIGQSERQVEAGMRLSQEAELALGKIMESAQQSTAMVRDIANATAEQAKSIRHVVKEMERVALNTTSVATTVREQTRASEQIAGATDRLGEIMPRLQRSADAQVNGGEKVSRAMQHIGGMVDRLDAAQGEQARESERILRSVGDLAEAQLEQIKSVERMQK